VRIEGNTVSVSGPLAADVELVADRLQATQDAGATERLKRNQSERERERERLRGMKKGRPKRTWTGLLVYREHLQ